MDWISNASRLYTNKLLKEGREVKASGGVHVVEDSKDSLLERMRQCRSIRGRREREEFLIEERPFIMQALLAEVPLRDVLITESAYAQQTAFEEQSGQFGQHPQFGSLPLNDWGQGGVPIHIIKDQHMAKLYPVDTPAMVAIAPLLHSKYQSLDSFTGMKRILVLDNVLNPRNIGMILRNAEAFEVEGILLLTGPNATELGNTQDILYSRLSISASRGAAFRVPFLHVKKNDFLDFATRHNYDLICTSPHGNPDIPEWSPVRSLLESFKSSKSKSKGLKSKKSKTKSPTTSESSSEKRKFSGQMIVIGNESEGVRKDILQHATSLMTIPTEVESLNAAVACGIVLFRLHNQDIDIRSGPSKAFVSKIEKDYSE
jgi:tRNA G18 (ribose-2'-O)-methylase SpoU